MSCGERGPRISVITGVYNITSLEVFPRAADSVLGQTAADFEWIICDDGSTDDTSAVLADLARRDSRVRVIQNGLNMGLAAALNRCLEVAGGAYIARQDADDISAPERFKKQAAFLDSHTAIGFVGSDVTLWDETGPWGARTFPAYPETRDFLFTLPFVHGALMFRREALDAVGGYRVARETRRAEDYDMLMRMYAFGLRGANLPERLYAFLEDRAAQKRRKYRYRIDEAKMRRKGFAAMGLMPGAWPYVVKPLAVGLIPTGLMRWIKRKQFSGEGQRA